MSESTANTGSTQETESKREPRALSTEYHKARKQLMLWAAILFIWQLVGIDLEKAKAAGGNAGAIIGALKSPQAVPWVLLILVLYFAFRLRIEWGQCNPVRRRIRESIADYYSAFLIATAACVLYFVQAISRIQLANSVQSSSKALSLVAGFCVAFGLLTSTYWFRTWRREKDTIGLVFTFTYLGFFSLVMPSLIRTTGPFVWVFVIIGFSIGLVVTALFLVMLSWSRVRPMSAT